MARRIMVQGTMSGAGKSLLCAALCRIFRQDGLRVAPFKSQNMALNSYVTRDGLEMGRAQVMQAQAAGIEPDVRMNPILLKPCSDTGSQVIVNGEVRGQMSAADYFRYKPALVPDVLAAYRSLEAECDVIVIEGAGSPAEINLREHDIVNMGLAELVNLSINQSFSRSLMTSITTCLALGVVCVVSVIYRLDSIYTFAFPLLFGMVSGVYSTICIATPLWVDWKSKKKVAKKTA